MSIHFQNIITVTNRALCTRPFLEQVERICLLHPKALVLREKDLSEADYEALAKQVLSICEKYDVPCILHSFPDVVIRLQQDAIHLPLWKLKKMTDDTRHQFQTIGCSIHSVKEAMEASSLGATYLTAGHIFTTECKKGLPPRGLSFLKEVCAATSLPTYGIGGIHLDSSQMREVMEAGADGVCIMSEMMRI